MSMNEKTRNPCVTEVKAECTCRFPLFSFSSPFFPMSSVISDMENLLEYKGINISKNKMNGMKITVLKLAKA